MATPVSLPRSNVPTSPSAQQVSSENFSPYFSAQHPQSIQGNNDPASPDAVQSSDISYLSQNLSIVLPSGSNQEVPSESAIRQLALNIKEAFMKLLEALQIVPPRNPSIQSCVETVTQQGKLKEGIVAAIKTADPSNIPSSFSVPALLIEQASPSLASACLHSAVTSGNFELVKLLCEKGADINKPDEGGNVPLHYAAEIGRADIVEYLCARGAKVNIFNGVGLTPSLCAARSGSVDAARFLFQNGAKVDEVGPGERGSIYYGIKSGSVEMVEYLVQEGAVLANGKRECVPPWAITEANPSIREYLISNVLSHEETLLSLPFAYRMELFSEALEVGLFVPRLVKEEETINLPFSPRLIRAAVASGKVGLLLEALQLLSPEDQARVNYTEIIEPIIFNDALKLTAEMWTHLSGVTNFPPYIKEAYAIRQLFDFGETKRNLGEHYGLLPLLFSNLKEGLTSQDEVERHQALSISLTAAIRAGLPSVVSHLVQQQGADINAPDIRGLTPLGYAIAKGSSVVKSVIELGADVNQPISQSSSLTPLMYAVSRGERTIIEDLLRAGADINARNEGGEAALHIAARDGRPDIVPFLLGKGADIDARDNDGRTALHVAAERYTPFMLRALMENGADRSVVDRKDETAFMIASRMGFPFMAQEFTRK